MQSASIIMPHRGPVPRVIVKPEALAREKAERKSCKGLTGEAKVEALRHNARLYYHLNKHKGKSTSEKGTGVSNLPVPTGGDGVPVRKRPGKIDALIAINRAAQFAKEGDIDGAELWARFAGRMLEGKE